MQNFSEINDSDGTRIVKASASRNDVSFFQTKVTEFVGTGHERASFKYNCNGDLLDLTLEEAHAAARSGGEPPFSCVDEGHLSVLKVTVHPAQLSAAPQPVSGVASSGRRRRSRASFSGGALTG